MASCSQIRPSPRRRCSTAALEKTSGGATARKVVYNLACTNIWGRCLVSAGIRLVSRAPHIGQHLIGQKIPHDNRPCVSTVGGRRSLGGQHAETNPRRKAHQFEGCVSRQLFQMREPSRTSSRPNGCSRALVPWTPHLAMGRLDPHWLDPTPVAKRATVCATPRNCRTPHQGTERNLTCRPGQAPQHDATDEPPTRRFPSTPPPKEHATH